MKELVAAILITTVALIPSHERLTKPPVKFAVIKPLVYSPIPSLYDSRLIDALSIDLEKADMEMAQQFFILNRNRLANSLPSTH
jgi:hypothetical protein